MCMYTGGRHFRKPSRFALFRSLSGSHKFGWPSAKATDSSEETTCTVSRRPSKIKKPRPRVADSSPRPDGSQSLESEMHRLTKGFLQQPEAPSHTTPEEKGDPDKLPAPGYSFGKFSTLPLRKAPGNVQPDQRPLPSRMGTSSLHQRRKASMSKLMRHFGETNIPGDLFPSPLGQSVAADTSEETQMPSLRKQRTRSLDLSSLAKIPVLEASDSMAEKKAYPLHRTHSLGSRSRKDRRTSEDLDLWEDRIAETAQNQVKRMRKMAQVRQRL
jgi:hypothetical protein